MADLDSFAHVTLKVSLLVHDFHGTPTQHVAWAHNQWVAERCGFFKGLRFGACRGIGRLAQPKGVQQLLKALTVFCSVNHVG